ncbi:MAG: D-aminoacylase [Pseudomonadota bacterium]
MKLFNIPGCKALILVCLATTISGCGEDQAPPRTVDWVLRGATVYDGTGAPGRPAELAIDQGRIVAFEGTLPTYEGRQELDLSGLALTPGFINMLSWSNQSLIEDGRAMGTLMQGVTLEVMGEGFSMGPINEVMRDVILSRQGDIRFDVSWRTLDDYLKHLVERGVSTNVASFVGASTVRIHELGFEDRTPTPEELARMQALVRQAMADGALGLGSALIYAPAFYADTDELVALAGEAARCGGRYISHLRNESDYLLEGVEELIEIARRADLPAEIYHLKAAGEANWPKLEQVLMRVEEARDSGLDISANMYTYTAGATGFDAAMPPWVQEGGVEAWVERLRDPTTRARVLKEMTAPAVDWENLYLQAGSPDRVLLLGFRNESLRGLVGQTLEQVANARGTSPEDTIIDLVIEDGSRVEVAYFLMSEDNIRRKIETPWMTFGSDAASMVPEGHFLKSSTHPRAYGNFARLLGRYVRDEQVIPLAEAVHRLTGMAADRLGVAERGRIKVGYHADLVAFDPATITDHATFAAPHQLATGVQHVFVNGIPVIRDGTHTGATPGQVVRGSGCPAG